MKILLLNAHFWPDLSAATGQMLTGLGEELARQGHEVRVICGRRKYDEPSVLFPKTEEHKGVRITRIWNSALGKRAKWRRAVDFATWLAAAELALLREPKPDVVVTLTTPPLLSVLGARYAKRVGARLVPWMMDLNPDEALAAGWLRQGSLMERFLRNALEKSFTQSAAIIALDRFMADRIAAKGVDRRKIHVVAPWAHDREVKPDPEGSKAFRREHGLTDAFIVMYSGNHAPIHPIQTVVQAARMLKEAGLEGDGRWEIAAAPARRRLAPSNLPPPIRVSRSAVGWLSAYAGGLGDGYAVGDGGSFVNVKVKVNEGCEFEMRKVEKTSASSASQR